MVDTADLVWAIAAIQAGLFSLLLAGLVLINRKLSRTIWDPFQTILDKLKKYQIDKDTSIEIPRSSTAEFRELSVVVSQLVRKNHEAFQSQKEFTENASHELQTPLAICRTKLELLAQTEELTQEQADLVESLFDAMERISRLIKNLLLLSKLDNRQFFVREQVQIEAVVNKCIESFSRQAGDKNLTIKASVEPGACVEINPVLFEVLISNLISNDLRHTSEGSTIAINATKESIEVSNDGLPFEYPERIFDRFRRESRTSVGNGLGLSIVKKVCDVTDNDVNYSYSSSRHHFKILFNNVRAN
jgi:signal transduction histidine kinase